MSPKHKDLTKKQSRLHKLITDGEIVWTPGGNHIPLDAKTGEELNPYPTMRPTTLASNLAAAWTALAPAIKKSSSAAFKAFKEAAVEPSKSDELQELIRQQPKTDVAAVATPQGVMSTPVADMTAMIEGFTPANPSSEEASMAEEEESVSDEEFLDEAVKMALGIQDDTTEPAAQETGGIETNDEQTDSNNQTEAEEASSNKETDDMTETNITTEPIIEPNPEPIKVKDEEQVSEAKEQSEEFLQEYAQVQAFVENYNKEEFTKDALKEAKEEGEEMLGYLKEATPEQKEVIKKGALLRFEAEHIRQQTFENDANTQEAFGILGIDPKTGKETNVTDDKTKTEEKDGTWTKVTNFVDDYTDGEKQPWIKRSVECKHCGCSKTSFDESVEANAKDDKNKVVACKKDHTHEWGSDEKVQVFATVWQWTKKIVAFILWVPVKIVDFVFGLFRSDKNTTGKPANTDQEAASESKDDVKAAV